MLPTLKLFHSMRQNASIHLSNFAAVSLIQKEATHTPKLYSLKRMELAKYIYLFLEYKIYAQEKYMFKYSFGAGTMPGCSWPLMH